MFPQREKRCLGHREYTEVAEVTKGLWIWCLRDKLTQDRGCFRIDPGVEHLFAHLFGDFIGECGRRVTL